MNKDKTPNAAMPTPACVKHVSVVGLEQAMQRMHDQLQAMHNTLLVMTVMVVFFVSLCEKFT